MNEEKTIFEDEVNYDGDYNLDTCDYTGDFESENEGGDTMKYVAVAAAAIGAFALVQKGVKAVVKKVTKRKKKKDDDDEPEKKSKVDEDEEIIDVDDDDIEEIEEDVEEIEEEKYPAKKKKKKK